VHARRRAPKGGTLVNIRFPIPFSQQELQWKSLPQNVKLFLLKP